MFMSAVALLSLAVASAMGQGSVTATSTAVSAPAATHTIAVGADGFNFSPNQVYANVGDIIEYRFYPQNHSVAKAAFGPNPCVPIEDTGPFQGFWSGFRPVDLVLSNPPTYQVLINDTVPVFFYCSAPGACFDGMVGVINPNATQTFQAQFNYSQNATVEYSPGELFPKEEGPVSRSTTATGATITPTPVASTNSAGATVTSSSTAVPAITEAHNHSGLSTGAIVGIAIGGAAIAILAATLIYMCGRQKTIKEIMHRHEQQRGGPSDGYQPSSPGMSQANYANMQKMPMISHYSGQSFGHPPESESYRSQSPPVDERTQMISMPPSIINNVSPQTTPGFPSPTYSHEMAQSTARSYNPEEYQSHSVPGPNSNGPHELAVSGLLSRNTSTAVGPPTPQNPEADRPFSYTKTPIEKY